MYLVVFQKRIINFSEVALLSVYWNSPADYIVIARGCRPGNTVNTAENICLLAKNDNKNTKTKLFKPFLISSKANFGPLTRTQAHSPDLPISNMTRRSPVAS